MSSPGLTRHATDLLWSLWTELGVSGVLREHPDVEIDPEALIVATPMIATEEPRLLEQALAWCVSCEERIATNRLDGLLRLFPEEESARFYPFASAVNAATGSRWPAASASAMHSPGRLKPISPPLTRTSLLRLRARALCGVGARADVVTELLLRPESWVAAEDLLDTGHSKRTIARTLADLGEAGLVSNLRVGNSRRFCLANPAALGDVLGGVPENAPRWTSIFRLVVLVLRLDAPPAPSLLLQRVAATKLWEAVSPLADLLWLDPAPNPRGEPEAWKLLRAWAEAQLELLALGLSPAIIGRTRAEPREVVGKLESIDRERREIRLRLPGERNALRVRGVRADPDVLGEIYQPAPLVQIKGRARLDLRGRIRFFEEMESISLPAAA